jgi:hypothetical protein
MPSASGAPPLVQRAGSAPLIGRTQLLAILAEHLAIGRPVEFVDVPEQAAPAAFQGGGRPEWLVTQLLGVFELIRQGAYTRTNESVRELTGRDPRTIADFARDHAKAFGG